MLSDLLSSIAEGGKVLLSEDSYLLARIQMDGREMLAELSRGTAGGIPPGEWPSMPDVLLPDSEIHPGDDPDTRILLFTLPDGAELLLERLSRAGGGMPEEEALSLVIQVLETLKALHSEGHRVGYLGPETVLLDRDSNPVLLGGARGVPDSPFSPPEAVGKSPEDPRSDVFALGLLLFRSIAGSDERPNQVDAWNMLSNPMLKLLEEMVQSDPESRYPNFTALSAGIRNMRSAPPGEGGNQWVTRSEGKKNRFHPLWYVIITLFAMAIVILIVTGGDPGSPDTDEGALPADSAAMLAPDTVITVDPATLGVSDPMAGTDPSRDAPVIWVSNGTGQSGVASEFREGPAASYSNVYKCTASPRGTSILLLRRYIPGTPLDPLSPLHQAAANMVSSDSTISIRPVDITILLGADLVDDTVTPGGVSHAASPAGTLFVDIANHGVPGVFGGSGAATWTRSVLDGYCVEHNGEHWLLEVVDFRDGDIFNPELGIPTTLDSTMFVYRRESDLLMATERAVRYSILEDSSLSSVPVPDIPVPDIWILLGL